MRAMREAYADREADMAIAAFVTALQVVSETVPLPPKWGERISTPVVATSFGTYMKAGLGSPEGSS